MREYDVELEGLHTETGPGAYEAAIGHDDLLRAADKAALFKTGVKEILARRGLMATFMAKWDSALPGCGGHVHQSLWGLQDGKNLFFDEGGEWRMSDLMRHYVAGQLELMPELAVMACPTVNSYKRLVEGAWAPTGANWGVENRTTALRVIPGNAASQRVEYRLPGADANPYLVMGASLAAGLYGVENRLEIPPRCAGSAYPSRGGPPLPRSLAEAVERFKGSCVAREILGAEFVEHFAATREWEVDQFRRSVTDWELERYFELI